MIAFVKLKLCIPVDINVEKTGICSSKMKTLSNTSPKVLHAQVLSKPFNVPGSA